MRVICLCCYHLQSTEKIKVTSKGELSDGIPKEIKSGEQRVAMIPANESLAGRGLGFFSRQVLARQLDIQMLITWQPEHL